MRWLRAQILDVDSDSGQNVLLLNFLARRPWPNDSVSLTPVPHLETKDNDGYSQVFLRG